MVRIYVTLMLVLIVVGISCISLANGTLAGLFLLSIGAAGLSAGFMRRSRAARRPVTPNRQEPNDQKDNP